MSLIKFKAGILIPTYNRKDYLEQALYSSITQTDHNIEIIVIDNGSTDGTADLMTEIKDLRVSFITNEQNIGLIGSINRGVGLFSDKVTWCTVLCDDDLLDNKFVESMQNFVDEYKPTAIVTSNRCMIDAAGMNIGKAKGGPLAESAKDYLLNRCRFNRDTFLTGLFFSRQSFEAIGGYPCFTTGMATDDAFIFALVLRDRLYCCENAVAYVRMHEGAESHATHGMTQHIRAMHDFSHFVKAAARDSRQFDKKTLGILSHAVDKYVRHHSSAFWLRNVFAAMSGEDPQNHGELQELFALADNGDASFNARVSLDLLFVKYLRICPEQYKIYRTLLSRFYLTIAKLQSLLSGQAEPQK